MDVYGNVFGGALGAYLTVFVEAEGGPGGTVTSPFASRVFGSRVFG